MARYDSFSYDDGFALDLSDTSDDDSLDDDLFYDEMLKENWFHGLKPRREIEDLLQEDGDFLVRASKDKSTKETVFTLSVFWNKLREFKIRHDETGWSVEENYFPTITTLINNLYGKCVTKKSQIILKRPIIKEEWKLKKDDIVLKKEIGQGNFGSVYVAFYKPMKKDVAVKKSKTSMSEEETNKFFQEGVTLGNLSHPNIVIFIGIVIQRQPMIVMEYVAGGNLHNYLEKKGKSLDIKSLIKMCKDACKGMAYLEKKSVLHRDLAARNCLVDKSVVKITDFGMSREEEIYTSVSKQIPVRWTAPESLKTNVYTSKSDVWSFGILMWEIFSRGKKQHPYPNIRTNEEVANQVEKGYTMNAPKGTPEACSNLMMNCWEYSPSDRKSFQIIKKELKVIHGKY